MDLENSLTWCKMGERVGFAAAQLLPRSHECSKQPIKSHLYSFFGQWQLIKKCRCQIILCAQFIQAPTQFSNLKRCEAGEADRVPTTVPTLTGFSTELGDLSLCSAFPYSPRVIFFKHTTWNMTVGMFGGLWCVLNFNYFNLSRDAAAI